MRSLSAIYRLSVKSWTEEGSFSAAAARLGSLCALGFDGVVIFDFDDSCGSSKQLLELVRWAHDMGLCVILDLACLTAGVSSAAPFIDTAVRQGLCDGFWLTAADMRFEDMVPTIARLQKERDDLYFAVDSPPELGTRPDGIARRAYHPLDLLISQEPASVLDAWQSTLLKCRHSMANPLISQRERSCAAHLCMDAALVLACLLPGVPHIDAGVEYAADVTRPTDEDAFAERRRRELLRRLTRLRREHPTLSSTKAGARMEIKDGTLSLIRRTDTGSWQLYMRLSGDEGGAFDRAPTDAPMLSYGLVRRGEGFGFVPYGYALYFVPKLQRQPREMSDASSLNEETATSTALVDENASKMQTII